MGAARGLYGASPLHLLGLLACFALAGAALLRLVEAGPLHRVGLWLVGAILLHDLVLYPAYTALDRAARRGGAVPGRAGAAANFVRIPTVLSAGMLLLFFPLILGLAEGFPAVSGQTTDVYLGRWLGLSGALFAGSAALYVLRRARARRAERQ